MSALSSHAATFERLTVLGETVIEALDYTQVISASGTTEIERTVTAIGARDLSPAVATALDALTAAGERVVTANDPHRAIDWIGIYPRLLTTLLVAGLNPKALPAESHNAGGQVGSGGAARLPAGISFSDAPSDGRAIVYSGIQADPILKPLAQAIAAATPPDRLFARAIMGDPEPDAATAAAYFALLPTHRALHDPLIIGALTIGGKAAQSNAQYRGAIVEATTAELLKRRAALSREPERMVRRERRFAVDGASADPHPFDVTVEAGPIPELWDCKWGARGMDDSLLTELEAARIRAAGAGVRIAIGIVAFDTAATVAARLSVLRGPREQTRIITLDTLARLAAG
jgi:hypothetical protein